MPNKLQIAWAGARVDQMAFIHTYTTLHTETCLNVLFDVVSKEESEKYQSYKGAVGTILCHNEAELKMSKEIDHQISSTDQAGKIK